MSAREEVLRRIRTALDGAPRTDLDVPRDYRRGGGVEAGDPALLDLLADRLVDYGAGVRRVAADGLAAAVGEAIATGVARRDPPADPGAGLRVVVPQGLPEELLAGISGAVVVDDALGVAVLDACDAVVTAATAAVAETGTIVLDGSPDQGRRAITLVPDIHVCVVRSGQVVAGVPEVMDRVDPARPLTWISGPSATSDIELDRVEGVHGPRILEVVIVEDPPRG